MNKALILVVEDDTPVRKLITTTLKTHDYKYLSAPDGTSAILEASSHNPDIVLLDLGLPDMTKPFSVEELLARLRATQRRLGLMKSESGQESPIFTNGELKIDYSAGCAYMQGEELHLTPIEFKLLCLLSRNVGKVLTHTYITQQIWGSSWENDVASLRVFMATLRKKLERGDHAQPYIQTHIGIGYRMLKVE